MKKHHRKVKGGKVFTKEKIPLDYIIIIDSGSKGSRVFIYNWLNPQYILEHNISIYDLGKKKPNLVGRAEFSDSKIIESEENSKKVLSKSYDIEDAHSSNLVDIAEVKSEKKWYQKITPGIASFVSSPQKVGNLHLKKLLEFASFIVPKSEHYRTPIFLHSTAGMRLLPHEEQQRLLDYTCSYIKSKSEFYLPDCDTHVNVIDGDVEGLYGWLSVNYLMKSLDVPDRGNDSNMSTFGILDMGGASTQVVFEPNKTEIEEHQHNLYKIKLSSIPLTQQHESTPFEDKIGNFSIPQKYEYSVFSDSFLGFGLTQAHARFLSLLVETYRKEHSLENAHGYSGEIYEPILNPCLPKGYTTKEKVGDYTINFTGESNFDKCIRLIFPVISKSSYRTLAEGNKANCKSLAEIKTSSSCLYDDLRPAFDFNVNHFIGVSGYWDAINSLLSYDENSENGFDEKTGNSKAPHSSKAYDYALIYNKTSTVCEESFSSLIELNSLKDENKKFTEEELSELCFKASWILNFLHIGLNMPRLGIDEISSPREYNYLQILDNFGGRSFSWTLGRAILYSNDEYAQAFINYSSSVNHPGSMGISSSDGIVEQGLIPRSGFYHSASTSIFHYGGEQSGIYPRPPFATEYFDDVIEETDISTSFNVSEWYIENHRWYGSIIFMTFLLFIFLLMMGKNGRFILWEKLKVKFIKFLTKITSFFGSRNNIELQFDPTTEYLSPNQNRNDLSLELDDLEAQSAKDIVL